MTTVLTLQPNKWAEIIEGNGEKCLLCPDSAKNVEHVLSKATVRGPQRNLCAAVLPFVSKMLTDVHGISILGSILKYGTIKTVELLAAELLKADKDTWTLKKGPEPKLVSSMGKLLDTLVYREDCREESVQEIIDSLSKAKVEKLLADPCYLPAAARLFYLDAGFAEKVLKDAKGKKSLHGASTSALSLEAVLTFCEMVLSVPKDDSRHAEASKFLFEAFFVSVSDGSKRPRERIIHTLVSKGSESAVTDVSKILAKWTNLRELLEREMYADIFSEVISRSGSIEAVKKIVFQLFENPGQVDTMLAARKKPYLRLLAAIDDKPDIAAALEKKLGAPLAGKLRGSKVRYTNATMPRSTATRNAVMAKLERLRQENAGKKTAQKRPRE